MPNVIHTAIFGDLEQQRGQLKQSGVLWIVNPSLYGNAVLWLETEVLLKIVDDYGLGKAAAESAQVLEELASDLERVLAVESVTDGHLATLKVLERPVGVVRSASGENDDFEVLGHQGEEGVGTGPD